MSGLRPDLDLGDAWIGLRRPAIEAGDRGSADGSAGPAVRLQRHQLLPARRDRRARQQAAVRRVRARRGSSRRSACARRCSSRRPRSCRALRRRSRARVRLAVRGPGSRCCAASCTIRRRGAWAASPGMRACSARRRISPIYCRMLLGGGAVGHDARARAAHGRAHDVAGDAGRRAERARPRLGPRLVVLRQSRRAAAARVVRTHGIHRHVDLDRSGDARVRRLSVEPRASGRHAATSRRCARASRRIVASSLTDVPSDAMRALAFSAPDVRRRRCPRSPAPPAAPVLTGIDVLRARRVRARSRACASASLTNHTGRARDGAATIDLLASGAGVKLVVALQSRARHSRHPRRVACRPSTDEKTGLPIHSLYGTTRAPHAPRCSPASTRSSSTCRTSARASTPT